MFYIDTYVFYDIHVVFNICLKEKTKNRRRTRYRERKFLSPGNITVGRFDEGTFSELMKIRRDVYIAVADKNDLIRILLRKIRKQDGIERTRYCSIRNTASSQYIFYN